MPVKLLLSALGLTISAGAAQAGTSPATVSLRYDGVYVSDHFPDNKDYCHYLRFYPTGAVIAASTVCDRNALKAIKQWLTYDNAQAKRLGLSLGKAEVKAQQISLSATSADGTVGYHGKIAADHLDLLTDALVNAHHAQETFSFVPW